MPTFAHQSLLIRRIATALVYHIVDSDGVSVGNAEEANVQRTDDSRECPQSPFNDTTRLEVFTDPPAVLDTCSPLNVRVDGGQKPYTVSLVPIKVAPPINITLGENDDSLLWVNSLPPNTTFFVTASDRSVARDL